MTEDEYAAFFESLNFLRNPNPGQKLNLVIDVQHHVPAALLAFLKTSWFSPEKLIVTQEGGLALVSQLGLNLSLIFRLQFWPSLTRENARMSLDGEYYSGEDALDPYEYSVNRLANVRDTNFCLTELQKKVFNGRRNSIIFESYWIDLLPKIRAIIEETD